METSANDIPHLLAELEEVRRQLYEANDTIEAIRTGQVDALVVQGRNGHELYTLKTADHAYRVFIEKMSEGVITLSPEGTVLYANSRFADMLLLELSQVIGVSFQQFVNPGHHVLLKELLLACGGSDVKGEVMLIAAAASIPVQLSLTMLELEEGSTINIILTDLSSQKASQRQLQETNSRLEQINQMLEERNHDLQQFASVASHDLQEPLRKIQMFSNAIQYNFESALPQAGKNYLDKIIRSAERMRILIVDVLNYSRLSASESKLTPIDLNEVVNGLLEDYELLIEEKKATIQVGQLPVIEANRGQIYQALQNLLSNALKFSSAEKQPVVQFNAYHIKEKSFNSEPQEKGAYCLLTIADNGIGFEQKYAAQIFSLFERLYPKDTYEGTGIGLAITKKIIDDHNGLIAVSSSPGNGAVFQIILPLRQS